MNIYQILEELNIKYKKHDHPPVFTCQEAEEVCKDFKKIGIKNLFLRDKKGKRFFLVIARSGKKIDLNKLAQFLQEKHLSFASEKNLKEILNLKTGSVSPFGLINDKEKKVKVVLDADLEKSAFLYFHPNENTATLEMKNEALEKFLNWAGNEVVVLK